MSTTGDRSMSSVTADTAERTLSTMSGSLERAGEAVRVGSRRAADTARRAGMAVRDRFRDSARALDRGSQVLRTSGITGAGTALALGFRRRKRTLLATAGAIAGGLLAIGLVRRSRGTGEDAD